jgi:hypothetical protein
LQPSFASDALHDIAQLPMMDVFEGVVGLPFGGEHPALLRWRDRLLRQEPGFRKPEGRPEGRNTPLSHGKATRDIRETMYAVSYVERPSDKTEPRQKLHALA